MLLVLLVPQSDRPLGGADQQSVEPGCLFRRSSNDPIFSSLSRARLGGDAFFVVVVVRLSSENKWGRQIKKNPDFISRDGIRRTWDRLTNVHTAKRANMQIVRIEQTDTRPATMMGTNVEM